MSGSAKTSGAGAFIIRTLRKIPNSGGLVIGSKPGERKEFLAHARACGSEQDVIFIGPNDPNSCNWSFANSRSTL